MLTFMRRKIGFCMILTALAVVLPGNDVSGEERLNASGVSGDYIIGSGDLLEIYTWKEPDFTREVLVRIDGKFSFPLLDDVQAAGLTPLQLKTNVQNRLADFVNEPVVTVVVKKNGSQRFYMLGEISSPGMYFLEKKLTVLQAIALAGGFTEWADKDDIILIRHEKGQDNISKIDYGKIVKNREIEQNIFLKADDTIIVP